eukprot:5119916-Pyramimonas_sp.AAC.1
MECDQRSPRRHARSLGSRSCARVAGFPAHCHVACEASASLHRWVFLRASAMPHWQATLLA